MKKLPEVEQEANLFAMLLLMPKKFIMEDIKQGFDLSDDTAIKELAKKYGVSITALTVRLAYYNKHGI